MIAPEVKRQVIKNRGLNPDEWDLDDNTRTIVRKQASQPTDVATPKELTLNSEPLPTLDKPFIPSLASRVPSTQQNVQLGGGMSGVVGQEPVIEETRRVGQDIGAQNSTIKDAALTGVYDLPRNILGTVVGAGITAAAAPETLGGSLAVGIPAGMATSAGAGAVQDALVERFLPALGEAVNAARRNSPVATQVGSAAGNLLMAKPTNPRAILQAMGGAAPLRNPTILNPLIAASVGAGSSLGIQGYQKMGMDKPNLGIGDIDLKDVALQAVLNAAIAGPTQNNALTRKTGLYTEADRINDAIRTGERNLTTSGGKRFESATMTKPTLTTEEMVMQSPEFKKAQEKLAKVTAAEEGKGLVKLAKDRADRFKYAIEEPQLQAQNNIQPNPQRAIDFEKAVAEENARVLAEPAVVAEKAQAAKEAVIKENEANVLELRRQNSELKLKAQQVENERIAQKVQELQTEPPVLTEVPKKPLSPETPSRELPTVTPEENAKDLEMRRLEESVSGEPRSKYAEEANPDTAVTKEQKEFWDNVAKKMGAKVEMDGSIVNPTTGKPVYGETLGREAAKEALIRISPEAGADTIPHELTHVFIDDMIKFGSAGEKKLANRIVTELEKTPEYSNWKTARDTKKLTSTSDEFLADQSGREAFRRLMKDKDNSTWRGAWKDFVAGAKVKWLKNAKAEDYSRFAANSIINANPTPVRAMSGDAGKTVPTKEEAVDEQVRLALDPASTRKAVLLTPGEKSGVATTGLEKVTTKFGDVLFNPTKTDKATVQKSSQGDFFDGTLLGMSQSVKPEGASKVVTTTSKSGVPDVQTEVVTDATLPAATKAAQEAVPGGKVEVKNAEEIIKHREGETAPFVKTSSYEPFKPLTPIHRAMQPVLNKLASTGKPEAYVAQRFNDFMADKTSLHGEFVTPVQRAVQEVSANSQRRIREYMRLKAQDKTPSFELNAAEKATEEAIRKMLVRTAEVQKEAGLKVFEGGKAREREIDPNYFPDIMNPAVAQTITQKPGSAEAKKLQNDFIEHYVAVHEGERGNLRAKATKELETMFSKGTSARTPEYAALTTPAGMGLPDSWVSKDLEHIVTTYAERAGNAIAYARQIQADPVSRKLLRIPTDLEGNKTDFGNINKLPDDTDISGVFLDQNDDVKASMRHVTRDYSVRDAKYNTLSRAIKASIMQAPAGLRDVINTPFLFGGQVAKPSEMPGVLKALTKVTEGYEQGLRNGTIRLNTIGAQDALFNDSAALRSLDAYASGVNKYGGREYLERFSRSLANSMGSAVYDSRIAAGDTKSLKPFLPQDNIPRTPEETRDYAVARMVESVQGTYDIRGLPSAALEGQLQTILSLSKWSIERQNNFQKHVVEPAKKGNLVPLLTSALGTVLGGAAIQKLNETLSKHKPAEVTWDEYLKLGGEKDNAYFWMSLASYSGMLGMQASVLKSAMDYKNTGRAQSGVGDPVLSTAGQLADTVRDAMVAYDENKDFDFGPELMKSLASTLSENARLAVKQTADDSEEKNDKRDRKLFDRLSGEKPSSTVLDTNPFLDIKEKKFEKEKDLSKAAEMASGLIADAARESKSGAEFVQKLQKLRTMPKQPMPDPKNDPEKFAEYFSFLSSIYSKDEALKKVQEYFEKSEEKRIKQSMIPKVSK